MIKLKDLEPIHIQNFYNELMEKHNLYAHLDTNYKKISASVLEDTFKFNDNKTIEERDSSTFE